MNSADDVLERHLLWGLRRNDRTARLRAIIVRLNSAPVIGGAPVWRLDYRPLSGRLMIKYSATDSARRMSWNEIQEAEVIIAKLVQEAGSIPLVGPAS